MKFLALCYYDMEKFAFLTEADLETLVKECNHYDNALSKSGKVIVQGCLSHPLSWKCVRPRNGEPLVTDGPYSFTNDQVAAFLIIEANDMDEAIRVASMHPAAHEGRFLGGGIEVEICEMYKQGGGELSLIREDLIDKVA